jgi:protein SCO1
MRRLLFVLLCSLLALAGRSALAQDIYPLPARWLTDQGQSFELRQLRGSWTVMTMAYGACRRICSTSFRSLQAVQDLADSQKKSLNFVVVGLDPSQDKPADWAALRAERKLTRTNWHFLSGDANTTASLAQRLGVRYWRYGENTMHDFRIVLISPDGKVARSLDNFDDPVARLLP